MARRARRALGLGLLLGAAGCATLLGPRWSPPGFVAYPEAEVAGVKNPHDHQGKPLCQRCHELASGALRGGPIALCTGCHSFHHSNHPVDVVQKNPPKDLPFLAGGKLACHTCHDPHAMKAHRWGLRDEFDALCLRCHARH